MPPGPYSRGGTTAATTTGMAAKTPMAASLARGPPNTVLTAQMTPKATMPISNPIKIMELGCRFLRMANWRAPK